MKKKHYSWISITKLLWKSKLLKTMRLTLFAILVSVVQIFATNTYSQQTRLSLNMKNTSIRSILEQIENQTDFYFIYNAKTIDVEKVVSINVVNRSITEILDRIFEGTNVMYKIENRQIAISTNSVENLLQQSLSISGKVTDSSGSPLPGVTVVVKGTIRGTITDTDGTYSLKDVPADAVLVFSFVGMATQEISIKGKSTMDVVMAEDAIGIEEVVAIGYGTIAKKELTGAVSQVNAKVLTQSSTSDLGIALQGQIAGVNVQASSGEPGASSNIQIRGLNTIIGANSPLYVVDGIPQDGDPKLSNNEIETIDVLKDAASASIYGTRGSGGVILITTKQGKEGQMKVSVDSYYGFQKITSGVPLMNFEEDLYAQFLIGMNVNGTNFDNTWTSFETNRYYFTNNTDLGKVIVNDDAPIQNYSLNISAGKNGLTYNINANYFSQEGSLIKSGYDRSNVRVNTNYDKGKWTLRTGVGFRVEKQKYVPWGMLLEAYRYHPFQTDIDPSIQVINNGGYGTETTFLSILGARLKQKDDRDGDHFDGSLQGEYHISKDITLISRLGVNYTNNTRVRIAPLFKAYDNEGNLITPQVRSGVYNFSDRSNSIAWENSIHFNRKFGEHRLRLTGVYSMESYTYTSFFAQKFDLVSNDVTVLNGATLDPNAGSGSGWNQDRTTSLIGILGRAQYDYKGRYLLSISARHDGSSRFSKEYRWGNFPSVSAGWNLSDESFWAGMRNTINGVKIRISYGTTGNQNFLDYSNSATITLAQDYVFGSEESDHLLLGAIQTAYANRNVKWEKTIQKNIGFDMAFFGNKLTFTGDYYDTNKNDMLFPLLIPPSAGSGNGSTVVLNVGNMNNKGMELTANYRQSGKFSWDVGAMFATNKNVVTKMSGANKFLYMSGGTVVDGVTNSDRVTVIKEGEEAGAFYMMQTNGVIQTFDELAEYRTIFPTAQLGDLRYVDQKTVDTDGDGVMDAGDGIINDDDRVYKGSGAPKFELGFNMSCDYKNFDFSMQWYGAFGNKVINGTRVYTYMFKTNKDLVYQWSPLNTNSEIPAYRGSDHYNSRGYTDYWIEDGTFVRLRNVTLGYTLSKHLINNIGISKLRVYVAAQNPLTLTKYTGFDPEVGNDGLQTRGIDKGNYPISSQYRAGIQIDF